MNRSDLISKEKWFVVHAGELYDINQNLIGFRDPSEWRPIKKGHIVFYYRTSPYQNITGIYEVIKCQKDIDRNFKISNERGHREYLPHQHELELINPFQRHFGSSEHKQLSFYHILKNPVRWDNQHIFKMSMGDVDLIIKL